MAKAPPLTSQERQRIIDLHAEGWTLGRIAIELGRSKSSVSKVARQEGVQWTDHRTAMATEAKVQTNREKRATLETRLLDEAGLLLDQLHKPALVYNFGGKDNTFEQRELPEPDVGAKRALVQAAGTAIDKAVRLAEVDAGHTGATEARGILGAFADGLHRAYEHLQQQDSEAPATEGDGR